MQYLSAQDLAVELSRDPLLILHRVLDLEISDMVGFEAPRGSEEEAEILALGLAGAPLELALRWCTACDGDERVDWDELAMYLTADLRPATALAREHGLWFTRADQLDALVFLATLPPREVALAIQAVLDRIDAPVPGIVADHIRGVAPVEPPPAWHQVCAPIRARAGRRSYRRFSARGRGRTRTTRRTPPRDRGRAVAAAPR